MYACFLSLHACAALLSLFPFLPPRCALLHGGMSSEEKAITIQAFRSGRIPVLICTVVVEVGVDVPDASIIVVEHADRWVGSTQTGGWWGERWMWMCPMPSSSLWSMQTVGEGEGRRGLEEEG